MVKKILKSLGVVLLLLLVYAAVQSVLSIAGIVLSLLYCTSSGLLEGNILDLMQQKISSFPAEAQAAYATGMAIALFLSTIVMLVVIHASGLYRIKLFSKPSIGAKPLLYSTVLVFVSIFALNIVAAWMSLEDNLEQEFNLLSRDIVGALTISVFAPILEEVMFRGAIQGYIMRKTGKPWLSILLASLVFGIFHMNPVQIAYASMLGVVLGWIYYRTGSLLSVIVGHVLNNSMATIVMLALSDVDVSAAQSVSSEIFSFVFFALLSLFFAWKLNRSLPPAGKRDACVDLETVN